ncbi:MAG: hypothetical protein KDD70_04355 [Bdellovibrionales bacterium]|nr:hypothetical protein [Bdellovibrionales bacterium]
MAGSLSFGEPELDEIAIVMTLTSRHRFCHILEESPKEPLNQFCQDAYNDD